MDFETCKEEQKNEVEVLKSIFYDEFLEIDPENIGHYALIIRPEEGIYLSTLPSQEEYIRRTWVFYLIVNCPETYPDSTPQLELTLQHPLDSSLSTEFELTDPLCPSPEKLEKLNEWLLNELKLQHTPGLVVIYTMITGLQEEMRGLLKLDLDELQAKETERLLEEERKEAKKFYGTPVTREGFLAWQKKFFSENPAFNFQQNSAEGKLTGRQLFEKDKTLVSSDSVLLGEDDECFDPSSFSEAELNFLDNLNLQDEEESALVTQLLLQSHE